MCTKNGFLRFLSGVAFLGSLTSLVDAQTDHSGNCSGTFTAAGNPHRLVRTCTVPVGETLTLESGVILEGGGWTLSVDGQLNADGVTLSEAPLNFRGGSGGGIQNSTLSGRSPISVSVAVS